jgi:hypothetical protein
VLLTALIQGPSRGEWNLISHELCGDGELTFDLDGRQASFSAAWAQCPTIPFELMPIGKVVFDVTSFGTLELFDQGSQAICFGWRFVSWPMRTDWTPASAPVGSRRNRTA